MKKTAFLMGIAALAFASCAKDTVKEASQGLAIDFRVAAQTRAAETTTANLSEFKVTAVSVNAEGTQTTNYFTAVTFAKSDEGAFFFSNPAYYWPNEGSLAFVAWAPVALTGVSVDNAAKTLADFTPAAAVVDQVDFVAATASGSKANETSGVALTFNHKLSQIQIKAKNAHEGYTYTVKGIRIANVGTTATYDFVDGTWGTPTATASYEVMFASEVTLGETAVYLLPADNTGGVTSGSAMLIPQALAEVAKSAAIELYVNVVSDGGSQVFPETSELYGWMQIPINTKWVAGNSYLYTLDLTQGSVLGEPIKFTTEVIEWNEVDIINNKEVDLSGTWEMTQVDVVQNDGTTTSFVGWEAIASSGEVSDYHLKIKVTADNKYYIHPGEENQSSFEYKIEDFKLKVEIDVGKFENYIIENLSENSVVYRLEEPDQIVRYYYTKVEDVQLRPEQ